MNYFDQLKAMREATGETVTQGLGDDIIHDFARSDRHLVQAINEAWEQHQALQQEFPEILRMNERDQIQAIQHGFVNFYADDAVNPYVALAARGPWIVTSHGAVIHDSGGYGMLGFGHAPQNILDAMNRPHVMANIMTASFSQKRLEDALRRELGHSRPGQTCPFDRFLCLNSGSEAVSVAARLSDINAKVHTDEGGAHAGKKIAKLALAGGFHGRTDRPAQFSDSSRSAYRNHLASFRDYDALVTVEPNSVESLEAAFAKAEQDNVYFEAMFMEPVMGEGNPGAAITREFYDAARRLTKEHGCLLLVDSIQAGLRAQGTLSMMDYPGFQDAEAPDMESYSKALNAGQYPLSVLAMNERAAKLYRKGIYGNTMTTNPRAMDVACTVLGAVTAEVRENIRARGEEFVTKLKGLQDELGGLITGVQGTGLLFSCELKSGMKAYGTGSVEEALRLNGVGVIHGGENSLRYTPHFNITSREVDMIIDATRDALKAADQKMLTSDAA
jgi:acetylornithine/succinyldiaminopimelate/putrescine aminotransferase